MKQFLIVVTLAVIVLGIVHFFGCQQIDQTKPELKQYYLRASDIPESRYDSTLKAWIPAQMSALSVKFMEKYTPDESLPTREVNMTILPKGVKSIHQGIGGGVGGSSCIVCSGYKICIVEIPDHCHIYMGDGCITIWCDGKDPRGTCCDEQWHPIPDSSLPEIK